MKMSKMSKSLALIMAIVMSVALLAGCGGSGNAGGGAASAPAEVPAEGYTFPLAEKVEISGLTRFPASTESEPNNRTIYKRLEEKTNVHVNWKAIQSDQWGDKIALELANIKTLPEFISPAGLGDADILKYAKQGVIIPLESYITPELMPNLTKVFEQAPEYLDMCKDENGHIWTLPWIEQLGVGKTAIQTIGNMPFINTAWLDFLGLEMPKTVDEFEQVLLAFRDNADALKKEFNIDGDIIPLACIVNGGNEDCRVLCNGFGEGYGDPDDWRHIVITDDKQVICAASTEGWRAGVEWLHKLYTENLFDPDAFTQEWSTYVAKGKSGRYGVCFSWDVANIVGLTMADIQNGTAGWAPMPMLKADTVNLTPNTGSLTSGFDRGRGAVLTANAKNPALICAWLDQMYDPIQSPQNNWGTYGEDDGFDIFVMGTNDKGEPMLQHADLGDHSPVEVREAEMVDGPLAVLDSYYGVYVTCPDDAQYRLDWIKDIYTPDMHTKYVFPNALLSSDDTKEISNLLADIDKCIETFRANAIMNGITDADWNQFQADLQAYKVDQLLAIFQKYVDAASEVALLAK
ncbi:MAG: extracellular solute-binding protein [Oscillospiraceae bacterium]|nr:extracellular solute-binding protein [Oscillospiraceae bacterium]